ncbi:hypothetical protein [Candidatus Binatus sp.]|uniref:hypothetical protein n=1 Tax=Candidatus Binatus sp. TaxID=2811406 RepID=UPI002F95B9C8
MTAKDSSREPSAAEWLTARPLLIFILFAIEILAIDFLRLPEIMAFDSYAFCDNGANLTLQYLVSHGLRPTIDFGYHYGLLPILIGRIWFTLIGRTPIAYQALMVACDLVIASAIARIAATLRFSASSLLLTAITLGFAARASYPSLAHAVEAALLSCAIAEQSAGKRSRALVLASAAVFAKPSMGYLYSVLLIALACRNLRGERVVTRATRVIAPAAVTSIVIAATLAASYGPAALIHTVLPLEGAAAYRALHYGFFSGSGRQFWDPHGLPWIFYLLDFSGFWITGTLFLICSGVAAIFYLATGDDDPGFEARRNEIIATCAVLHVAFIALFFGNHWSWIYYAYFLTIGVAAAAGASAIQRRVTLGLCVMGIMAWTDVAFWEQRWWHTRDRDAVTAGLWAAADERAEWQRVLDTVHSRRAVILDTKGAIELLVPGFEKPVSLYLDPGWMVPADIQRKVGQMSQAEMVVVPANIGIEACRGIPAAPEFETALKSFEPRMRGKFFDVYQRPSSPNSPAAR